MFKLYYINYNWKEPEWEHIGDFETYDDMQENIKEFFDKHNFVSYYRVHTYLPEGFVRIDFGSYSQFYKYKEVNNAKR